MKTIKLRFYSSLALSSLAALSLAFSGSVKIFAATASIPSTPSIASTTKPAKNEQQKPNVIIIFTDDQGYQDLGVYGSPDIKTPHIDQMATDGMRFTDFYVASPVCSPSRAALLTGKYPYKVGVPNVLAPNRDTLGLAPEHETIAEVLKSIGYNTKAVGKWHLGDVPKFLPTNQGFDSYYGIPYSNDMVPSLTMKYADDAIFREGYTLEKIEKAFKKVDYHRKPKALLTVVPLMRNEEAIELPVDQTSITRRYTDESIQFIEKNVASQQPFFLYLAHTMPHIPLFASEKFRGKSKRGPYGDVMEELDHETGRLFAHLKRLNIDNNTLVIFASDNGPWLRKGKDGGSAFPLFDGKHTNFEGGMRVPAIIKWPGKIPAGVVSSELATTMDILPTLMAITGAKNTTGALDGKNILNILKNEPGASSPHQYIFYDLWAVRQGDWKYQHDEISKAEEDKRNYQGPTLYNLKEDIGETTNLITKYPEIAKKLQKVLKQHVESLGQTLKSREKKPTKSQKRKAAALAKQTSKLAADQVTKH